MPVVVTLRDGEEVEFENAVAYRIGQDDESSLDILPPVGGAVASFHPNAWQYVSIEAAETPSELLRDWLEQGSDGDTKTIRVGGVDVPLERMELRDVDGVKYVHVELYSRID